MCELLARNLPIIVWCSEILAEQTSPLITQLESNALQIPTFHLHTHHADKGRKVEVP